MSKVLTVTEARNNLPALVKEVAQTEEEIIITTRNHPMAVLMGHRAFQSWLAGRQAQARAQLEAGIMPALELIESAEAACQHEGAGELFLLLVNLEPILKELWEAARDVSPQHLSLVGLLLDATEILLEGEATLQPDQPPAFAKVLERLRSYRLSSEEVTWAGQQLINARLSTLFPVPGDLAELYEQEGYAT